MTITRAPKGIPSGGQFTANRLSEPTISLSAFTPVHGDGQHMGLRGAQRIDGAWAPEDQVAVDPGAGTLHRRPPAAPESEPYDRLAAFAIPPLSTEPPTLEERLYGAAESFTDAVMNPAEHVYDLVTDFADDVSDARDRRKELREAAGDGNVVGWGRMLPKFMRLKSQS
jgi:hypothetical protein